jgi:hypothetical protein
LTSEKAAEAMRRLSDGGGVQARISSKIKIEKPEIIKIDVKCIKGK